LKNLTDKEMEVLRLLSEGYSIKEISELLCYSYSSIANRRLSIYDKLGAVTDASAVAMAFREGILE